MSAIEKRQLSARDIARFATKVRSSELDKCWPWNGTIASNGYGFFSFGGRMNGNVGAHRIAWLIAQPGDARLERGDEICHSCDNPICVNPHHLFRGSHSDNMADARKKGIVKPLQPRYGQLNNRATLDETAVREIRRLATCGTSQRAIAAKFGVKQAAVWNVIHRRTWAHVA